MTMRASRWTPRERGFTLIELVITVAIVGILAAIAMPAYQSQVRKSRRTDAKTAVLDLAGREERYFSLNGSYTVSAANLGYAGFGTVGSGYYQVAVNPGAAGIGSSFVVSATPVAGQSQTQDTACQYFSVDNIGNQLGGTSAGAAVTSSVCWQ